MWRYGLVWLRRLALVAIKLTEDRANARDMKMLMLEKGACDQQKLEQRTVESTGDIKNRREKARSVEKSEQCGGCSWSLDA